MSRQISTIVHNFPPEFPETTVERYPNLTLALGDKYPGLRTTTVVDENDRSLQPFLKMTSNKPSFPAGGSDVSPEATNNEDSTSTSDFIPTWVALRKSSDESSVVASMFDVTQPPIPGVPGAGVKRRRRRSKRHQPYASPSQQLQDPSPSDVVNLTVHFYLPRLLVRSNQPPGKDADSATKSSVFKFVSPIEGPEVSSDTAPMPRGVVWDAEGPLVWREAPGWKETHHPKF
ncbi:hypothetical protein B0H13DRAFT_1994602, partial [Mycena leptocephala]